MPKIKKHIRKTNKEQERFVKLLKTMRPWQIKLLAEQARKLKKN